MQGMQIWILANGTKISHNTEQLSRRATIRESIYHNEGLLHATTKTWRSQISNFLKSNDHPFSRFSNWLNRGDTG